MKNTKGFTFIELLCCVLIIFILVGLVTAIRHNANKPLPVFSIGDKVEIVDKEYHGVVIKIKQDDTYLESVKLAYIYTIRLDVQELKKLNEDLNVDDNKLFIEQDFVESELEVAYGRD